MPLTHYSERHLVRLLATETRRTDLTPHALASSHVALGRFLAGELSENFPLEQCDIQHPQGMRKGWKIANEQGIALLVFMRSGLYVAEGVRELLQHAPLYHVTPNRSNGLDDTERKKISVSAPHTVIIIDAVVNTGASLEPVLAQLSEQRLRIFVLSLVSPKSTAERLAKAWPTVCFLFARVSDNQYVGLRGTDTGNRLFGTSSANEATPT